VGFARRVRPGYYGQRKHMQARTVSLALTATAKTISLAIKANLAKVLGQISYSSENSLQRPDFEAVQRSYSVNCGHNVLYSLSIDAAK
jgi:hypothetical protein